MWVGLLFAVAGIVVAIPLSLWVWRHKPKRSAGFVVASALLFSFPFLGGRGPELIEEAKDETNRKKDAQSGEPPVAGGDA